MKKYLFFAVAALAMTGCSQDEVMEVAQKEAISFGDAFVENATRAIDATYNNEKKPASFLVYGNTKGDEANAAVVTIFKGVHVSKDNTTGVGNTYFYDAQYTQYWIAGNTYNFAAVVDAKTVTTGTDGLPTTITYDVSEQKDLLYASALNITTKPTNGEVGFTFDHLLSKAMFTVKNEMANNTANSIYFYRVSNVEINKAYTTGTYYVAATETNTAGSWTAETNSLTVDFGNVCTTNNETEGANALEIGMASSAASNYQRVMIPATYTDLNVTCTIETLIKEGDEYKVVDVQNYNKSFAHTFEKGKAYNFVIKLALEEPIKFTVQTINDWDPKENGTEIEIK